MPPTIDNADFDGANDGLKPPVRRVKDGQYELAIANLDRADPPAPYRPGDVPRARAFNANIVELPVAGGMPRIDVACRIAGFDPAAAPIHWRLQALHVLGRFHKTRKGHYSAKVVRLADEWQGQSTSAAFALFDPDRPADHVAGSHAILTVAARPPGATGWLQDYVHLRIVGTNPDEQAVRAFVATVAAGRDGNLAPMLDAIFAWEAGFKQFQPGVSTSAKYQGVRFDWPDDPERHPVAAFDFGIGLSQFTHPDALTASIAWDWRDNMRAGINIFLAALDRAFEPNIGWRDWAWRGWRAYNGAAEYADARAASADGKAVSSEPVPHGFDVKAFVAPLPLVAAPEPPPWPVSGLHAADHAAVAAADEAADALSRGIVAAVAGRAVPGDVLAWLWPKLEAEILGHDGHDETPVFPGLSSETIASAAAVLTPARLGAALRTAFVGLAGTGAAPAFESVAAMAAAPQAGVAPALDLASEWSRLSTFVQANVIGGFGAWSGLRGRMFKTFGAPGDPETAIPRINAYYGGFVELAFPRPSFRSPVHPEMKRRLARASALLVARDTAGDADPIRSAGGFAIRENVNSPDELSNHSFGWALDLDPELNPNIRKTKLPLDLIEAVTGVDLYGTESESLRTSGAYDEVLPAVRVLSGASAAFKAAFQDEAGLKRALVAAVDRVCGVVLSPASVDAALERAKPAKEPELRALLSQAGAPPTTIARGAAIVVGLADLFRQAAAPGNKPAVTGTAATVARFGFFNLQPTVAAALIASDGGGLSWLGAAKNTKDFMHFELRSSDRPPFFA